MRRWKQGKDYQRRLVPRQRVYLSLVGDHEHEPYFADVFLRIWKKVPREARKKIIHYVMSTGLWVSVEVLCFGMHGVNRLRGMDLAINSDLVKFSFQSHREGWLEYVIAHELAHSLFWAETKEQIKSEFPAKTENEQDAIVFQKMKDWPEKSKEEFVGILVHTWGVPLARDDGLEYEKYISRMTKLRSARSRSRVVKRKKSEATQRRNKSAAKETRGST